jgi:hypothetical protein
MRKSHFNNEFLVLLGPIVSRLFACSNEEKNKPKQQRVRALVLSLWYDVPLFLTSNIRLGVKSGAASLVHNAFSALKLSQDSLLINTYLSMFSLV